MGSLLSRKLPLEKEQKKKRRNALFLSYDPVTRIGCIIGMKGGSNFTRSCRLQLKIDLIYELYHFRRNDKVIAPRSQMLPYAGVTSF